MTSINDNFVLKVRGDSMADEGILDGDIVIVNRGRPAENSDMVVVKVDGLIGLRRIYRDGENVRLVPSNASMAPSVLTTSDIDIQGVVVGLMRRF